MLNMHFEIDGRRVDPKNITDELERSIVQSIADDLRTKLGSIRDPDTGEFPTVVVRGNSLDNLSITMEGSDAVVAMASKRLERDFDVEDLRESPELVAAAPNVFLCHATEDKPFVTRLATDLKANGIEVFFDQWSIQPGDSIRQRIDQGVIVCTHFVVVLTESSIDKPWVNLEMDAGLVRKLSGQCCIVPLRLNLDASRLPPTLSGMLSPTIEDYDRDVGSLVGFFYGVSRSPRLGTAPHIVTQHDDRMGVSAVAKRIVDRIMAGTQHGLDMDPQLAVRDLQADEGMTDEQIEDGVFELEGRGLCIRNRDPNGGLGFSRIYPTEALFVEFDHYYGGNDPREDAVFIAVALMNEYRDGVRVAELAETLSWSARRINPAVSFLSERKLIDRRDAMGTGPFCAASIGPTHATRRFLASRG